MDDPNNTRLRMVSLALSFLIVLSAPLMSSVLAAPRIAQAPTLLTLDGVGENIACGPANCAAQSLTTNNAQDVIILIVECGHLYCPVSVSSITDSSGLSFARRVSYTTTDGIWEYYSVARAPLLSDNITVIFSGAFPLHGVQVLGIGGANIERIFDPSPSAQATIACWNGASPYSPTRCWGSIQPSTIDFVIVSTAINDAPACTVSPGFTTIRGGGSYEVDYKIMTIPQTNLVFGCRNTDPVAILMDAISVHRD